MRERTSKKMEISMRNADYAELREKLPELITPLEKLVGRFVPAELENLKRLLERANTFFVPAWNRGRVLSARATRILEEKAQRDELWGKLPGSYEEQPLPLDRVDLPSEQEEVFAAILAIASKIELPIPAQHQPRVNPAVLCAERLRTGFVTLLAANLSTEELLS